MNNSTSLYTKESLYHQINYTISQYKHINDIALGPYAPSPNSSVRLCVNSYKDSTIDPSNFRFKFPYSDPSSTCKNITTFTNKSINEFVAMNNIPSNFSNVDEMWLILYLQTIKIDQLKLGNIPKCVKFKIKLIFHNEHNTGNFKLEMKTNQEYIKCGTAKKNDVLISSEMIYDSVVIMVCVWSFVLTSRSLYRNFKLAKITFRFFRIKKNIKLSLVSDGLELVNAWFIIIILTDILTIVGSIYKIYIDMMNLETMYFFDVCSMCLGISVLFIWIGILRYLGFLKQYNVLLITLETAMPNVLRFLSCAGIIYMGFLFCGWIVIGPYHPKFTSPSIVSESLFSLLNGDDMFRTFRLMSKDNYGIWIFCKIYLYVFISLFIYIVLSLFIGIISDAYERLKAGEHVLRSNIQRFIHGPGLKQSEMFESSDVITEPETPNVPA